MLPITLSIKISAIGARLKNTIEGHKIASLLVIILSAILIPVISQPLPSSLSVTIIQVSVMTMIYMVLALGLNIVPGFTGLLDLGYVGFYGVGAYTAGLLSVHFGMPFWLIIPLAALNGALFGILLGAPTLRLTGDYFAIVTFGFSELVVLFLTNELWLTRGPNGITGIEPVSLFGFELTRPHQYYYVILAILVLIIFAIRRIEQSRVGRAWFAIRDDEIAASSSGINIVTYKVLAFALSASVAAIGGAFFAQMSRFISPDPFTFWESIFILCLIVLGGMGSVTGVLVGTLILFPLINILREFLKTIASWASENDISWIPREIGSAHYLLLGLIMVVMMRFRPAGLLPRGRGPLGPSPVDKLPQLNQAKTAKKS